MIHKIKKLFGPAATHSGFYLYIGKNRRNNNMKNTKILTVILAAAIGITCLTACSKPGRKTTEPDETRKPRETTAAAIDEDNGKTGKPEGTTAATVDEDINDDVIDVVYDDDNTEDTDEHNREVLAEALNLRKSDRQIDDMLKKLNYIEAGKISDLEYDADNVTLYFKGEDGTEYLFYFTNEYNLSVMGCKNLTTGEMEFASYQ